MKENNFMSRNYEFEIETFYGKIKIRKCYLYYIIFKIL